MNAMLHDEQAEKFVLGALLVSEECYYSIADRLKPELFYDSKMARLAGIVIQLYANDSNVNIVTVTQYLLSNPKQGDPEPWEIAEYSSSAVLSAFEDSFRVIESLYVRRRYFSLGVKLMDYGTNLTMRTEDVEKEIQSVLGDGDTKKKRVKSLRDANIELKENVLHNYDGTSDTMIPTGFYEIDRRGGLQTGDFDVIAAESSMGKALSMDELILTPSGWVMNKDLKVGDEVASVDGKPSFVTGIYPQGIKDMYCITFNDGRTAKCSGEHLWEVWGNSAFHGKNRVMSTLDIIEWMNRPLVRKATFNIPMFCGKFGEKKEFIIHPYILGILIGDGCLTNGTTFVSVDEFIVNRVKELSPLPIKRHASKNRVETFRLSHGIKGKKNIVREELRRLGLFRHTSYDKFIPNEYLDCCYEQRLQLLNGLMDSDGDVDTNGCIRYSTKSKRLADDVVYLCRSLGFRVSVSPHKTAFKDKVYSDHYRVTIAGKDESVIFSLPRKVSKVKLRSRVNLGIEKIEYVGREECQCIKVSHPRELFIMRDFIVTHNTSLLICMMVNAAKKGVPCMIYSMEMMSSQLAARIVSPIARISSGVIQYRKLSNGQMNDLSDAISQTDALPIYFDDESTISIDSIISSIRLWVRRLKIKLIGIDYLQILSSVGNISNQEQFLGGVCRRLKNLAKELQVCIIALSQLSRNTSDPKPTLGRLRASGQITEAADVVALIWRPSEYGKGYDDFPSVPSANTAELIIGKGRNIGKFNFIVGFDRERTYFYNYEREIEPQQTSSNEEETDPFSEPKVGELPF